MGNIEPRHLAVIHGKHSLVRKPPYKGTVTMKASTQFVTHTNIPEQESASWATTKMAVVAVIQELALVQEENMITPTLAETKLGGFQIMETSTLKLLDTS